MFPFPSLPNSLLLGFSGLFPVEDVPELLLEPLCLPRDPPILPRDPRILPPTEDTRGEGTVTVLLSESLPSLMSNMLISFRCFFDFFCFSFLFSCGGDDDEDDTLACLDPLDAVGGFWYPLGASVGKGT